MKTNDISEYLNRDLICSKIFYGLYPANKIHRLSSLPALIVCNTDTSSRPGEHWIVLYVDGNRRGEYFDSMCRFPTKRFKIFLDVNCTAWIWNEKQLESVISKFCGHYCIFYCLNRCRGVDVREVAKMFTKDTIPNDSLVHNFVCNVKRFLFNKIEKRLSIVFVKFIRLRFL